MHMHMYHEYESVYEYGSNAFELQRLGILNVWPGHTLECQPELVSTMIQWHENGILSLNHAMT